MAGIGNRRGALNQGINGMGHSVGLPGRGRPRRRDAAPRRPPIVFASSILVGLAGAYLHWVRAILPSALPGEQVSVPLLVWAPPILGPLTFSLVGMLGISAAPLRA